MRRAASRDQLELPGLLSTSPAPALPEPLRAVACARCGWLRELPAACPVCQHRAPIHPR